MPESLTICQVSPHPWGSSHEVNDFVENVSDELARRGHRVLIAAPSDSRQDIREGRAAIRAAGTDHASLWPRKGAGPKVLCVGQSVPLPRGTGRRAGTLPIDVSRSLEALLASSPIDIVHVHEPFAPSTSSVALRHSHSLNVGTFHEPQERLLSTQVARPLIEIFFGRLDARTASSQVTADLLERFFPGSYELLRPGASAQPSRREDNTRPEFFYAADEERGALRLFLRALRRMPLEPDWGATIWVDEPELIRVSRKLRDRVRVVGPSDGTPEHFIAGADVVCAASGGPRLAPSLIRKALASGAVPVASHLEVYSELTGDGERGLLFPPGDAETLAGQLVRLAEDPKLLTSLRATARRADAARSWADTADELEEVYGRIAARRHSPNGNGELRRRLASRQTIDVDLHMHTDHSPDCATPVEVLLETARDRGLGAIAITDHNEVSGALEAAEIAKDMDGLKIIVAEEVKTAEQGEVIGLFIKEKIPRGMTMAETIAAIRAQGGLVYMPHPFDRFHSVPDYEHLLDVVEDVDILEVFNPRIAVTAFNDEAVRFAAKYRIVPGAGSDSHVAQGLGSVRIRLHDFDGPEEFLESMRDADIVTKHKNLVYVQTLKFLQTTGRPKAAKRKVANPKPVRGGRRGPRRKTAARRGKS